MSARAFAAQSRQIGQRTDRSLPIRKKGGSRAEGRTPSIFGQIQRASNIRSFLVSPDDRGFPFTLIEGMMEGLAYAILQLGGVKMKRFGTMLAIGAMAGGLWLAASLRADTRKSDADLEQM